MMPKHMKKICNVLAQVIIIIVSLFMIMYSIRIIQKVGNVPSPATGIPRGYYYSLMPISFVVSIFYAFSNILKLFIPIVEPVKGYKDDLDLLLDIEKGDA